MDSLRAQIEQITLAKRGKTIGYQWFDNFQKGSLWAHCTNIKGLKEF
jgi:hypothetical protein